MKFGRALREVVRFEILYKLFILCLVNPVMREIYQTYISSVGVSFNAQIVGIFLNLKGAFIFLLLFFTAAFLIFFELSVVVRIVALCRAGAPFRLRTVSLMIWSVLVNTVIAALSQLIGLARHRQQQHWVKTEHSIDRRSKLRNPTLEEEQAAEVKHNTDHLAEGM